jgi:hypothetical protein
MVLCCVGRLTAISCGGTHLHGTAMRKKRTASDNAFSMSMRLAYRVMMVLAEDLASLVSRIVGSVVAEIGDE